MMPDKAIDYLERDNILWRTVQQHVMAEAGQKQDHPALATPGAAIDWLERQGLHLVVRPIGEENAEDAKREIPAPRGESVTLLTTRHFEEMTGHREGELFG